MTGCAGQMMRFQNKRRGQGKIRRHRADIRNRATAPSRKNPALARRVLRRLAPLKSEMGGGSLPRSPGSSLFD
ncbi:MAG TPA: hypothetical protein DEA50_06515 [Parvularcula sp.]|nr:hypothetical protein [Parvularcula sp.]